jgi:hypothetical protein
VAGRAGRGGWEGARGGAGDFVGAGQLSLLFSSAGLWREPLECVSPHSSKGPAGGESLEFAPRTVTVLKTRDYFEICVIMKP